MRTYCEPIQVDLCDHAPHRFEWRGRRFRVAEVLSQWAERTSWWRTALEPAANGCDGGGNGALEDEVWRVEARAERGNASGVYDLAKVEGVWQMRRVVD